MCRFRSMNTSISATNIFNFQDLSPGSPFFSQNILRYLSLSNNRIMFIDSPECFEGLKHLKELDLSGNKLAVLREEYKTFRELSQLEMLDLSNNKLAWIAADVFTPLMSLLRLKLDGNRLKGDNIIIRITL